MIRPPAPIPLRTAIDADLICRRQPCDEAHILGSFWPHSRTSFESRVVKGFKECVPTRDFEPHISALGDFYAQRVLEKTAGRRIDWVVRVLGSTETRPDPQRPLALTANALCRLTGARDAAHLLFKTESRPPMRFVGRLSGPEALKARVRYVLQDLFIRPGSLGGTALLIDDIANTGASMRVYAQALKSCAGIERVVAVNLAATRFARGRDGRGMLALDTAELDSHPQLRRVFVDCSGVFHFVEVCPAINAPAAVEMRFLAERGATPCAQCAGRFGTR